MKNINVVFTDDEYDSLQKQKNDLSWHDFILSKQKTSTSNIPEEHVILSKKDIDKILDALDRIDKISQS